MKKLSEIIEKKSKDLGGFANLARELKWGKSEKNPGAIIGQYVGGKVPSLDFAVRWKKVFNENLIDMIVEDEVFMMVAEPAIEAMEKLEEPLFSDIEIKQSIAHFNKLVLETMQEAEVIRIAFERHEEAMKKFQEKQLNQPK